MLETGNQNQSTANDTSFEGIEPLLTLASSMLDTDRLRVAGVLAGGPANRLELEKSLGIGHRDLMRHLDCLQQAGLVSPEDGAVRPPDHFTRYKLNPAAFTEARRAMGRFKGVRPRPTDARLMTLETFMPGGRLGAFPKKHEQIITILDEVAQKFELDRQYKESEVNVILEEVNEDYCQLRRMLVDYGYMTRDKSIYTKKA